MVGLGIDGGGLSGGALLGLAVGAALLVGRLVRVLFVAAGLEVRLEALDVPVCTGPGVRLTEPDGAGDTTVGDFVGAVGAVAGAPSPLVGPAVSVGLGELVPATLDPASGPARATVTTPVAATASAAVPAVAASTSRTPRSRRRPALERRG